MSVVNQNMFSLLADEESVPEAPEATSPPPPPAPATEAPAPRSNRGRAPVNTSSSRSGKYPRRGGAPVSPMEPVEPNPNEVGERFNHDEGRADRGQGRGRGRGGRGGRTRSDGENHRGRPFDKHSQTGKVDTEKKIEQGWGANSGDAELTAETQGEADAQGEWNETAKETTTGGEWDAAPPTDATAWNDTAATTDAGGWNDVPADTGGWSDIPTTTDAGAWGDGSAPNAEDKPERKSRREDEEDNTLTLDQYLAKKKGEEASALPKAEGRQISDNDEWKGAVQLLRADEEDVYYIGKSKATSKPRAKKEDKVFIEIDAHFERPGGRGRGGRGRGRGSDRGTERGRGRGRGGRHGESNGGARGVDVDDQSAFPSLA